jgi:hypothetical protein
VSATVLRKDRRLSFRSLSKMRLLIVMPLLVRSRYRAHPGRAMVFSSIALIFAIAMSSSLLAAKFVDAIVAQVGLYTIAASDIALARALGLYDLPHLAGPIRPTDVERFIDARLIVAEAERLNITPPPAVLEKEWRDVVVRRGGTAKFRAWLKEKGISMDWARRLANSDAQRKYFTQLRFARFVFIPEEEIDRALGPGTHEAKERERTREVLRQKQAELNLARWLEQQRKRAKIRRFTEGTIPDPLE